VVPKNDATTQSAAGDFLVDSWLALPAGRSNPPVGVPGSHSASRIDADETRHAVGFLGRCIGHFLVWNTTVAALEFGIDGEHHEANLPFPIIRDGFGDRRTLADLEILAGSIFARLPQRIGRLTARDFGVSVDVDQVVDVH